MRPQPLHIYRYIAREDPGILGNIITVFDSNVHSIVLLIMSGIEGLVDLSLFATSPTDDRHFALPHDPPQAEPIYREVPCYRSQRERNGHLPRSFAMKPLPPLPARRLCRRRPARGRHDVGSRCILMRIKKSRLDDGTGNESPTIQQRRNAHPTPQLTLSVPPPPAQAQRAERAESAERAPRPTMVWLPEEQMWLIQDAADEVPPYYWDHTPPPGQNQHRYTRSEPSPDSHTHFDLSPTSPVRNQFLSLMESSGRPRLSDRERLNPLFQQAVQTVPMTDISPLSPPPSSWLSNESEYQSYHTAAGSLAAEEPPIVFPQLAWENAWEGDRGRLAEESPIVFPQLAWENSWECVVRRVERPASALG